MSFLYNCDVSINFWLRLPGNIWEIPAKLNLRGSFILLNSVSCVILDLNWQFTSEQFVANKEFDLRQQKETDFCCRHYPYPLSPRHHGPAADSTTLLRSIDCKTMAQSRKGRCQPWPVLIRKERTLWTAIFFYFALLREWGVAGAHSENTQ